MIIEVLFVGLAITVVLNTWTTLRILRDDLAEPAQKWVYSLLVWFIPVLGALVVLHLQRRDNEPGSGQYSEAPNLGEDFGKSLAPKSRYGEVVDGDS